ncbi:MAG: YbaK/EbsC family protein [Anaerolineae bacterium]|nr:YbaK/EbsC family protein [Anaerolineae bacterium]
MDEVTAGMGREELAAYIAAENIDATIIELDEPTPTVETAAEAVGTHPSQIIKSLLFLIKRENGEFDPLLVITNGTDRVDYVALARFAGTSRRSIRIANAEQVEALTGYQVGAVPPFGHKQPLPTLLDETVLEQDVIYGGGGTSHALMRVSVDELRRVLPDAAVAAVTQSSTTS